MQTSFFKLNTIQTAFAVIFFTVFCIYFMPSGNQEIRIHDNFDGNFTTRHVLVKSGHFFDTDPLSTVPGIMNGLPRGVLNRFTEITSLLMFVFGSLPGYALTFLIVRILAFLGVYIFGRDHLQMNGSQKGLLLLMSCTFACLPFFIIHGLTVAGIPLALWAFFNLYKKQRKGISYAVLILFVLWSNFVLVGFHLLLCLGFLALYFCFKDKRFRLDLFAAIVCMTVLYVLTDYMLFYMHLFADNYHSSRGEMEKNLGLNLKGVAGGTVKSFLSGDFSTANYVGLLLLPFIAAGIWIGIRKKDTLKSWMLLFLVITIACAFLVNLLDWTKMASFYEKFPIAKIFNFKRFNSLLPGLFFICGLIAVAIINPKNNFLLNISGSLLLVVMLVTVWRGNISYNRSAFDTRGFVIISEQKTTFNQFFDPLMYAKIKKEMGADTNRNVIHFSISPAPAKYAGLHVLDDYQGDYPKEYKEQFRKVIKKELDKSEKLKSYFDNWGSRCYMESANTFSGSLQQQNGFFIEPLLEINTSQLKQMNCSYILSSVLIGNAPALNLASPKVLVSPTDYKTIFLYKLL